MQLAGDLATLGRLAQQGREREAAGLAAAEQRRGQQRDAGKGKGFPARLAVGGLHADPVAVEAEITSGIVRGIGDEHEVGEDVWRER